MAEKGNVSRFAFSFGTWSLAEKGNVSRFAFRVSFGTWSFAFRVSRFVWHLEFRVSRFASRLALGVSRFVLRSVSSLALRAPSHQHRQPGTDPLGTRTDTYVYSQGCRTSSYAYARTRLLQSHMTLMVYYNIHTV